MQLPVQAVPAAGNTLATAVGRSPDSWFDANDTNETPVITDTADGTVPVSTFIDKSRYLARKRDAHRLSESRYEHTMKRIQLTHCTYVSELCQADKNVGSEPNITLRDTSSR